MLGLGFGQFDALDHQQVFGGQTARQSHLHGQGAHLAVDLEAVIAGLGAKHDGAATPHGRTIGAGTGATGALLLPGLHAAAGNEGAGLGHVGTGALGGHLGTHHEVEDLGTSLNFKHVGGKRQFAAFLLVLVINFHGSHCCASSTACGSAPARSWGRARNP